MTPAEAIADLDAAVRDWGETITLRRVTGTAQIALDVDVRACVRGYAPAELVANIKQGDSRVIVSPTEMKRAQWTWPPRVGDRAVIGGKVRAVEEANPITMGGELVRIELRVRG